MTTGSVCSSSTTFKDGFEQFHGSFAPLTGMPSEDQAAADELLTYGDPARLDAWLAANPDPARQAAMMAFLAQFPEAMTAMLTQSMSNEAMQRVADAFGHALANNMITSQEIAEHGACRTDSSQVGKIIGLTHDEQAITTFVDATMAETGFDDDIDPCRAQAAAFALAGLSGQQLDTYLNTRGEQLQRILSMIGGRQWGRGVARG